jgi:tripartite ATP-independent transporter DctP family solute receptor
MGIKMGSIVYRVVGMIGVAAAMMTAASGASAQEVLRVGAVVFGDHSSVRAIREVFVPEVAKNTQGRYKVEIYSDSQLGGNAEVVQQTRNGTIFGCFVSAAWVTSYVPKLGVGGLPFLFADRQHAFNAFDGPAGDEIRKALDSSGFVTLGFMELGFRHLTTSRKKVSTPADLKGLKIRLQSNPVHIETFRLLGANPVQIDGQELFAALNQGVADGQENPFSVISLFKLYEAKQKYLTETGHFYDILTFLGSKRILDKMTPADRDAILAAAAKTTELQRRYAAEEEDKYRQNLVDKGVEITKLTPEQRKAFEQATAPVYAKIERDLGADFVKRFIAAARGN